MFSPHPQRLYLQNWSLGWANLPRELWSLGTALTSAQFLLSPLAGRNPTQPGPSGEPWEPRVGTLGPWPLLEGPGPPAVRHGAGRCLQVGGPQTRDGGHPGLSGRHSKGTSWEGLGHKPAPPPFSPGEKAEGRNSTLSHAKTASQAAYS